MKRRSDALVSAVTIVALGLSLSVIGFYAAVPSVAGA